MFHVNPYKYYFFHTTNEEKLDQSRFLSIEATKQYFDGMDKYKDFIMTFAESDSEDNVDDDYNENDDDNNDDDVDEDDDEEDDEDEENDGNNN
jgi:hypothetical protein